jgi:hypothetical protein
MRHSRKPIRRPIRSGTISGEPAATPSFWAMAIVPRSGMPAPLCRAGCRTHLAMMRSVTDTIRIGTGWRRVVLDLEDLPLCWRTHGCGRHDPEPSQPCAPARSPARDLGRFDLSTSRRRRGRMLLKGPQAHGRLVMTTFPCPGGVQSRSASIRSSALHGPAWRRTRADRYSGWLRSASTLHPLCVQPIHIAGREVGGPT